MSQISQAFRCLFSGWKRSHELRVDVCAFSAGPARGQCNAALCSHISCARWSAMWRRTPSELDNAGYYTAKPLLLGATLCGSHLVLITKVHSSLEPRKHEVHNPLPSVPINSGRQTITDGQRGNQRNKCSGARWRVPPPWIKTSYFKKIYRLVLKEFKVRTKDESNDCLIRCRGTSPGLVSLLLGVGFGSVDGPHRSSAQIQTYGSCLQW